MSLRRVFSSSVGTKLLIGLTGLLLFAYLLLHLAGNLLIFAGRATFNTYAHTLVSNPLTVPVEIALALVFLIHVYKTVTNWFANLRARPIGYEKKSWAGYTSRKSLGSTTMIWTGLVTLLFVGVHLAQMKYGAWYEAAADAPGRAAMRDLYRTEVDVFSSPLWAGVYVVCMILIGFHLRHGISSAFQSMGVDHAVCTKRLVIAGTVLAIVIAGGFAIIPIWVYFSR